MRRPVLAFAGMTHLGLTSAAAAAEHGFTVVGFDPEPIRIASLTQGALPVVEPELPQLLARNRSRLTFTDDPARLSECDVTYVAADVSTDDHGGSDLEPLCALVDQLVATMASDAILVVLSQVPPGFTRRVAWPPARTFYQVETLIVGRAVDRALRPERVIVGAADPRAALPPSLSDFLASFGCPILTMSYESAELAKIAINMCLVASISTANTLAELCEKIGADWGEIVPALRLDRRIGPDAYLAPGLGLGGGNLERDLATFVRLADTSGADARVVRAWLDHSRRRSRWALTQLHERVVARVAQPTFAVLGLSYKPDTASTKNSAALALLESLRPFVIRAWDPVVAPRPEFHPRLIAAASALDACAGADAVAIMTPCPEFRALSPDDVARQMRGRTVIDPYTVLDPVACRAAGLEHVTLGAPLDPPRVRTGDARC